MGHRHTLSDELSEASVAAVAAVDASVAAALADLTDAECLLVLEVAREAMLSRAAAISERRVYSLARFLSVTGQRSLEG
jgi:hypothetical protein